MPTAPKENANSYGFPDVFEFLSKSAASIRPPLGVNQITEKLRVQAIRLAKRRDVKPGESRPLRCVECGFPL